VLSPGLPCYARTSLCSLTNYSTLILVQYSTIHSSVLNWFKSCLSYRYFRVKRENNLSFLYTSSCGVPKAPFSVLYSSSCIPTAPLSTLISSLFHNNHLYADDPQLFFYPHNFDSSTTYLQNALHFISSFSG